MSEQIAKNIRGENPDVPVSLTARFPMLNPAEKFFSYFNVYSTHPLLRNRLLGTAALDFRQFLANF